MYTQGLMITLAFAVVMLLWIMELIRRKNINEALSLWWFIIIILIIILILCPPLLQFITRLMGTSLPITTIFLLCLLFVFVMLVYFSMKISTLSSQILELTQSLAILDGKVSEYGEERKPKKD